MARKVALQVYAVKNYCIVTDYDDVSLVVHNSFCTGMGEFLMDFPDSIGIRLGLTEKSTNRRIEFTFDEISLCQINAVDTGATDIYEVRDALAPYFFSVGGGGEFAFYTEATLTSAILLNQLGPAPGYMFMPAVAGHYYDFKINWEYTRGTASYSTGASAISFDMLDGITARPCCLINGLNLSFASSRVCPNIRPTIVTSTQNPFPIGSGLYIRLASNGNATLGDGSVLLKIWYNLIAAS